MAENEVHTNYNRLYIFRKNSTTTVCRFWPLCTKYVHSCRFLPQVLKYTIHEFICTRQMLLLQLLSERKCGTDYHLSLLVIIFAFLSIIKNKALRYGPCYRCLKHKTLIVKMKTVGKEQWASPGGDPMLPAPFKNSPLAPGSLNCFLLAP